MRLLPTEPEVKLYEDGFGENDILERKKVGKRLSDLLGRIDDPMVVALDGRWGTGKTHFLKRWVGAHREEFGRNAITVYFDAFAHDYISDPLPGLISALEERVPHPEQGTFKAVKRAAFNLAKPAVRMAAAVATSGATEVLGNVGDAVVEVVKGEVDQKIDAYWAAESSKRKAMQDFKEAIRELSEPDSEENEGSTLVFVIDELDRCRPDYALEVLETIKHFFDVPRVHFVLGVNLEALENSVRARYGSGIDASAYLRKFIHVSLGLPSKLVQPGKSVPTFEAYLKYLISKMDIPIQIEGALVDQFSDAARGNKVSNRDVGKVISLVPLLSEDVLNGNNLPGWISVMCDLLISRVVHPEMNRKFLNASLVQEDILSYFGVTKSDFNFFVTDRLKSNLPESVVLSCARWEFLSGVKGLVPSGLSEGSNVALQFDQFGRFHNPSVMLRYIEQNWMNQFSLL